MLSPSHHRTLPPSPWLPTAPFFPSSTATLLSGHPPLSTKKPLSASVLLFPPINMTAPSPPDKKFTSAHKLVPRIVAMCAHPTAALAPFGTGILISTVRLPCWALLSV